MKIPIFHKFYSINILIYLILLNLFLVVCNPFANLAFLFKIPLENLNTYCRIIYCLNIYLIPVCFVTVFIEILLRKLSIIKNICILNTNKILKIFVYFVFILGFIISIFLNIICTESQIPYTPQELEQLRFD